MADLKKIRADVTNFMEVRRALQQLAINVETVNTGPNVTAGFTGTLSATYITSIALDTTACTLSAVTETLTLSVNNGLVIVGSIT